MRVSIKRQTRFLHVHFNALYWAIRCRLITIHQWKRHFVWRYKRLNIVGSSRRQRIRGQSGSKSRDGTNGEFDHFRRRKGTRRRRPIFCRTMFTFCETSSALERRQAFLGRFFCHGGDSILSTDLYESAVSDARMQQRQPVHAMKRRRHGSSVIERATRQKFDGEAKAPHNLVIRASSIEHPALRLPSLIYFVATSSKPSTIIVVPNTLLLYPLLFSSNRLHCILEFLTKFYCHSFQQFSFVGSSYLQLLLHSIHNLIVEFMFYTYLGHDGT